MKRILTVTGVILLCSAIVTAEEVVSSKLIGALQNCSSYSDSGVINTDGMEINADKKILGWENDRCVYREKLNFNGINTEVTCKFTKPQISELVSVMLSYETLQKYTGTKVDTSSLSAVADNPVVNVWNKYFQDPSTCTIK